jgi:hypothetical protein
MKRRICILILLLFVIFFQSCNHPFRILGKCSSSSIKRSKENGTFLSEYIPYHIKINDSIQFTITQVFAEKQYGYKSHLDPSFVIETNKSQIVVILEKNIGEIKGLSYTWRFKNLSIGLPKLLYIDFNNSIPPDTVQIEVVRRDINSVTGLAGSKDDEKIGHFILMKKIMH